MAEMYDKASRKTVLRKLSAESYGPFAFLKISSSFEMSPRSRAVSPDWL